MTRRSSPRPGRAGGFTLIEVMAAVFILGLVVAAVSQTLSQAQRQEGEARRQARAAALADRLVAEIEEGLARGAPPALGSRELREADLVATTEVAPLDPAQLAPVSAGAPAAREAADAGRAGEAGGWLDAAAAEQTPPVFDVRVHVVWDGAAVDPETQEARGVRRRTFALNPVALEALETLDEEAAQGERPE